MPNNPNSPFYLATFHTIFEPNELLGIATELKRLCDEFPQNFKNDLDVEITRVKDIAQRQINFCKENGADKPEALDFIYSKIRKKSLIGEMFIAAFLCIDCSIRNPFRLKKSGGTIESSDMSDQDYFKIISAHKSLIAILSYRASYSSNFHIAKKACDELRHIVAGLRDKDYCLVDTADINLESFFSSLQEFHHLGSVRFIGNQLYYSRHIGPLSLMLGITPNYPAREIFQLNTTKKSSKVHRQSIKPNKKKSHQINLYTHQENLDQDPSKQEDQKKSWVIESSKLESKPAYQQILAAKEKQKSISSRARKLPCDISVAEANSIKTVLNYFSEMDEAHPDHKLVQLILLSLFLGQPLTELVSLNFKFEQERGHYLLFYFLDLPQPKQISTQQTEIIEHRDNYYLIIPACFNDTIAKLNEAEYHIAECRRLLRDLNNRYDIHLTLTNISKYLEAYLLSQGVSKLLIHLLSEPNPNHQIALYYTSTTSSEIRSAHRQYALHLQENLNHKIDLVPNQSSADKKFYIGSKAIYNSLQVSKCFNTLKRRFTESIDKFHRHDEELHNALTTYTIMLTSLCTGYRPVKDLIGHIGDFNLNANLYHIADKDRGDKIEGRIIFFEKTLHAQLVNYSDFLELEYNLHQQRNPNLALRYRDSLNNKHPLVFFRDGVKIIKPEPSILRNYYKKYKIDMSLNWHRHYIRTLLAKNSFSDDLINCWMGHDDEAGSIPFSRYSTTSVVDLKKIATFIEKHIQSLSINPISYDK